jgi:hypothetical protein
VHTRLRSSSSYRDSTGLASRAPFPFRACQLSMASAYSDPLSEAEGARNFIKLYSILSSVSQFLQHAEYRMQEEVR